MDKLNAALADLKHLMILAEPYNEDNRAIDHFSCYGFCLYDIDELSNTDTLIVFEYGTSWTTRMSSDQILGIIVSIFDKHNIMFHKVNEGFIEAEIR